MGANSGRKLGAPGRWIVVAPLLTLACAGANAAGSGPSNGAPGGGDSGTGNGDLKAQFEREAEPAQKHVVRGGDAFSAYIEAKSPPKVERKGPTWSVTADLGWGGGDVQCLVYDDVIDAGTAAHTMLKAAAKDVSFKGLAPYFLEHHGLDPVVGIRGVYQVVRNGTTLAGDFKLAVAPRMEHPVMCWHDAPGYAKSFARVTTEFAKSFEFKSNEPPHARGELWTLTLDGTPVGFSRDLFYQLEDGGVRSVTLSANFVPAAPGEMSFNDEAKIETLSKDGTLTTGRFITIENGESQLSMDVERTKAGYDYVGTVQNKEVKGHFKPKEPIKGQLTLEQKLRALGGKAKKAKFEQWEYLPSLDSAGGTRVSYEVTSAADGMTIETRMGNRGATLKATPRGVVKQAILALGAKKLQVDLVEAKGEL